MQFETYPFEKLNKLLESSTPNPEKELITLTIGEPQFDTPLFIQDAFSHASPLLNKYPKTGGETVLRNAIHNFIAKRFKVDLLDEQLIPTFGTREVLFNFPQFVLHDKLKPTMAFPNPFYQIYEGAAIASRAKIVHIDLLPENDFKPNIQGKDLKDVNLVILNFPNNPCASVLSIDELKVWVEWALEYDFILLNDECYSEIYTHTPPPSLLEASIAAGNTKFKNVVVINSISKRSSAPGLRSGFIAGDAKILDGYMQYRTYVGCASPLPLQYAAAAAWNDEHHVEEARKIYQKSFELADHILGIKASEATFYLWMKVEDDEAFTKYLYESQSVKVLPGSYLGRNGIGQGFVRIALVENEANTKDALHRIETAMDLFAHE